MAARSKGAPGGFAAKQHWATAGEIRDEDYFATVRGNMR